MSYTLGQAAKATGLSKSTIQRAIKAGKISATRDEASEAWQIDPADLHRVYPTVAANDAARNGADTAIRLEEMRHLWDRERVSLERVIDDLRNRLDAAEEERRTTLRQLTALLTDQRAKTSPDVIVTPPPTSNTIPTPAAAPTAPVAASPVPAAKQPSVKPLPVVKVRKPPKEEVSWLRKLICGK
jgi:excisionase family DNA binding protein